MFALSDSLVEVLQKLDDLEAEKLIQVIAQSNTRPQIVSKPPEQDRWPVVPETHQGKHTIRFEQVSDRTAPTQLASTSASARRGRPKTIL